MGVLLHRKQLWDKQEGSIRRKLGKLRVFDIEEARIIPGNVDLLFLLSMHRYAIVSPGSLCSYGLVSTGALFPTEKSLKKSKK